MRKLILAAILATALLITGCANTEIYTPQETPHEYNTEEPTPPPQEEPYNITYDSTPDTPNTDEYIHEDTYEPQPPPLPYPPPQDAIAISSASTHALALMEDGGLWAWGAAWHGWYGASSLIGDGTEEDRPRPVQIMDDVIFAVAGHHHSFAITTYNTLWAWGGNFWGQLGDGTTEDRLSPVKIMDDVVYATMPSVVPNSHAGDGARSYAIRLDGTLWAWGANGHIDAFDAALGDGTTQTRYYPVQILENVASIVPTHNGGFALTHDGNLWHWHGTTWARVLEDDEYVWATIDPQLYPIPILENIAQISTNASFAITHDGELWAIGGHAPVYVMSGVTYATGLGGANFAITTGGDLLAWGRNRIPDHWRQGPLLGDGTTTDRDTPVKIMENVAHIKVKGNAAYVITQDNNLWAWGNNGGALGSGILGDGTIFTWDDIEEHMWDFLQSDEGFQDGIGWLLDDDGGTGLRLSPVKILENVIYVAPTYFMLDHGWINGFRTFALTERGAVWAWGTNTIFSYENISLLGNGSSELQLYPVRII